MNKTKVISLLLALTLSSSMLAACGQSNVPASSVAPVSSESTPAASSNTEIATNDDWRLTGPDKKVVTVGGELSKMDGPIYITSVGQSADVSMLDALMKKVGAEYTFNATAKADDIGSAKVVLICAGASSKGLGAAGISADDEKARAKELLEACKANGATVIMAHLGGTSRRGALSDEFSDLVMGYSQAVLMVEDGNDDGKFSSFAKDAGIPITFVNTIADCLQPLKTMFGA